MRRRVHYAAAQAMFEVFHHLAFGFRVHGLENVPLAGACLLAANHKSYLDPLAIGCPLRREMRYFAKRELFNMPLLGPAIRSVGGIPVDRHAFDRHAIQQALEILRGDQALLLFPEGTRIRRAGLGTPKDGVAMLALGAEVPVIPVWVAHTWEPARTWFRRIPVEVHYGTPVRFARGETGAVRRARYPEVSQAVMNAIEALAAQASGLSAVSSAGGRGEG